MFVHRLAMVTIIQFYTMLMMCAKMAIETSLDHIDLFAVGTGKEERGRGFRGVGVSDGRISNEAAAFLLAGLSFASLILTD